MKCKDDLLVLVGAAVGGAVGYFAFFWVSRQGFLGLVLPGGLLGLGAGVFKTRSAYIAAICGVAALALSVYAEWVRAPFIKDDSFGYFIAHLHELKPIKLIMLAVGTIIGFWIPFRRSQDANRTPPEAAG
jgi:hypothetical protein